MPFIVVVIVVVVIIIIIRFPCMEGDGFSIHKLRQIVWAADGLLVGVVNRSCDEDSIVEYEINESCVTERLFIVVYCCLLLFTYCL